MPWTTYLAMVVAAGLALVVGSTVASWLAGVVLGRLERVGLDPAARRLAVLAVRPLVLAIALVAALGYVGADADGLVVVLGAAALSVGLAARGQLSNLASGAVLLTLRPYRDGELVEVGGVRGTVVAQGWYAVTVRTADGAIVVVPNDQVLAAPTHNLSRNGRRRVDVEVVVAADADVDAVIDRLRDALAAEPRGLPSPAPEVVVDGIAPNGVHLRASLWVAVDDHDAARADVYRAALRAARAAPLREDRAPLAEVTARGDAR